MKYNGAARDEADRWGSLQEFQILQEAGFPVDEKTSARRIETPSGLPHSLNL